MSAGNGNGGDGRITVTGRDEPAVVAAALSAVLDAARTGPPPAGGGGASAVAIRGQGPDLASLAAELINDLLAQLDANGSGFGSVRLDGLLRTHDGYTAWGYLLGAPSAGGSPPEVSLAGTPDIERRGEEIVLRLRLVKG